MSTKIRPIIARVGQLWSGRWLFLLMLLIVLAVTGNLFAFAADSGVAGDYAYYTQRYWQAAAEREARLASQGGNEAYSYYTERYWQAAATRESELTGQDLEQEYAFYTQRYWQAAAAREAEVSARQAEGN
jgi:hypothetical protein